MLEKKMMKKERVRREGEKKSGRTKNEPNWRVYDNGCQKQPLKPTTNRGNRGIQYQEPTKPALFWKRKIVKFFSRKKVKGSHLKVTNWAFQEAQQEAHDDPSHANTSSLCAVSPLTHPNPLLSSKSIRRGSSKPMAQIQWPQEFKQ